MAKATLQANASENWHTPIQPMPQMNPVFAQGAVYFVNQNLQLQAIDYQSGETRWTNTSIPVQALQSPVWVRNVLYVATDTGQLFAINPVDGSSIWSQPVTINNGQQALTTPQLGLGFVTGAGQQLVLYMMDLQNLYMLPLSGNNGQPPEPQTVFTLSGDTTFGLALVYDSSSALFVVNTSAGLIALRPDASGGAAWTQAWEVGDLGGYCTPPVAALGNVYVGTPNNNVAIVNIASGSYVSSATLIGPVQQPILVDSASRTAFAPTVNGVIYQLDAENAATSTQFQPGGQVTTPLILSDGIAYYGSQDNNVYGFELSAPTGNVLAFETASPIVFLAGVSSGTVYLGTETNLHCVDFASVIHQFNVQSQLMVDLANVDAPRQVPAYQSHITLFDSQNNIRPNESVKIWSSSPTTLTTDNQEFSIGPDTPVCFQSDSTGKLIISIQATSSIQPGIGTGLSTPALLLWASFMDPPERILIYPDQRLHAKLHTMSGSDLQAAAGYNQTDPKQPGPTLLPSGFQGGAGTQGRTNAESLASAINNVVALKPPSPSAQLTASDGTNKYLAFPEDMTGVSYASSPPDTSRSPYAGEIPNWSLDLSGPDPVFTPQSDASAALQASVSFKHSRLMSAVEFSFGDIGDFINDVVNGVEQALHTAWSDAEGAIQATIHGIEKSYQFVVHTIEDAAHVALGILKSVLKDVENAVELILEALSWLFAWEDILATHSHIKSEINNAFSQLATFIGQMETTTDDFFNSVQSSVDTALGTLITQLGGSTLGESAQNASDPNQTYSQGGENYSVQGNWMFHKSMTSMLGTHGSLHVGTPPSSATSVPAPGGLAEAMLAFLEAVGEDALSIAENLATLVSDAVNDFIKLISDPGSIRAVQLATLLGVIKNLADNLVQLGKLAADAFFTLLKAVLTIVQDALNASIDVPFISWLYKLITGDTLTILDLFCLILAVPVTVVYKAITGNAPFSASLAYSAGRLASAVEMRFEAPESVFPIVQNIITTVNGLIYAFVDAISNGMGSNSPGFLNYVFAVLQTVGLSMSLPLGYSGDQMRDYMLLWIYRWFTPFWSVHCGFESAKGNQTSAVVMPFHGVGTAVWSGVYAILYPTDYFGDGFALAQNELGAFSTMAGILKLSSNPEVLAVLVVIADFFDTTNALIGIRFWFPA